MKKITLFVFILLCIGFCSAQQIDANGATLKDYSAIQYDFLPLENNSEYFSAYIAPKFVPRKNFKHQLLVYDKGSNTLSLKTLTPSGEYTPISAFNAGDHNFGIYEAYDKKIGFTIATAEIPLADPGSLHMNHCTTISSKELSYFDAHSSNGTKHAVALISYPKKSLPLCHILIYDQTGTELVRKSFTPQISGDFYEYKDMTISNDGDVTLLLCSEKKKGQDYIDRSLHIAVIGKDADITEYRIPAPSFGEIHSAKMLLMKNGKHFIGGYYGENVTKPSTGYYSYIFDPNTEDIVESHNYALPSEQCAKNQIMLVVNFRYKIATKNIFELDNGKIVMLGEHRAWTKVTSQAGNMITTYYSNRASDIVFQTFNGSGESDESQMIRKLQSCNSNAQLQNEMSFNYQSSYEDFGESFSAFQKGNDIYLLYNNNANAPDADCTLDVLSYNRSCIRCTKIAENGEITKTSLRKCDVKKNYFQTIWMVDGDHVFFGTDGKPGYLIESMSIE